MTGVLGYHYTGFESTFTADYKLSVVGDLQKWRVGHLWVIVKRKGWLVVVGKGEWTAVSSVKLRTLSTDIVSKKFCLERKAGFCDLRIVVELQSKLDRSTSECSALGWCWWPCDESLWFPILSGHYLRAAGLIVLLTGPSLGPALFGLLRNAWAICNLECRSFLKQSVHPEQACRTVFREWLYY